MKTMKTNECMKTMKTNVEFISKFNYISVDDDEEVLIMVSMKQAWIIDKYMHSAHGNKSLDFTNTFNTNFRSKNKLFKIDWTELDSVLK